MIARVVQILAVAAVFALAVHWLTPGAPTIPPAPASWQEPYGGCDEAPSHPGTPGWTECMERGLMPPCPGVDSVGHVLVVLFPDGGFRCE